MIPEEPINITDKGSYLLVEFFGEFSVTAGKRCVDRMVEACEMYLHSRVLLDCRRMTGNMSMFDRFEVVEYGTTSRLKSRRVALVGREDQVPPNPFVENVAFNRGMNVKDFTSFDEAVSWLSESASSKPDTVDGK